MMTVKNRWRPLLLLPGGVALLAGVDAGLLLLGLPAPVTTEALPQVHGMILTLGFVGTVIALERAVALRRRAAYLAPIAFGLGGIGLLTPFRGAGQALLVLGGLGLLGVYAALWRRQESVALALQVLGAAGAVGGAVLWWGGTPVATSLPWLVAFLVLTISGERLELARVTLGAVAVERTVMVLGAGVLAGAAAATLWPAPGTVGLGFVLLALTVTLLRHDVARRTVRSTGLTRYMAVCLLAAYGWAILGAGIWALLGPVTAGPGYDAVIHAFFLGYTMSMIMAHAPVILPAVIGRPLPYGPALYVPVALLHLSLLVRVVGGDRLGWVPALEAGGALNVAAVLLFLVFAVVASVRGERARPDRPAADAAPASVPAPVPVPAPAPVTVEENAP